MQQHGLSELAHKLGHEMMTPLSGLTMLLSAARSDGTGKAILGRLDEAIGATKRMATLLRAFVDYIDAGEKALVLAPVDLAEIVADVAREFPAPPIELHGDLPRVRGDRAALRRVLRALLDNAVRYSTASSPDVAVTAQRDGDRWRIEVADRGVGIAAEDCARVLEPLVRLHAYDEVPGAGFGLATSARLLRAQGGELGLRPRPGGGTIAWFTLPA